MLINQTINQVIINNHKILTNFFEQSKGLMFSKKDKFNEALIFEFNNEGILNRSLHMWFVPFSINVIFLNTQKEVVDIKNNFRPFTVYTPKHKCKYIIELPNHILNFKLGDKIEWL